MKVTGIQYKRIAGIGLFMLLIIAAHGREAIIPDETNLTVGIGRPLPMSYMSAEIRPVTLVQTDAQNNQMTFGETKVPGSSKQCHIVIREGGAHSIYLPEMESEAASVRRYVCYYDQTDEVLSLSFRIQQEEVSEGETVRLTIGFRDPAGGDTLLALDENRWSLSGLPEGAPPDQIPVLSLPNGQSEAEEAEEPGSRKDVWYQLILTIPDEETADGTFDDKTLVLLPLISDEEGNEISEETELAEVWFVKRYLFELD